MSRLFSYYALKKVNNKGADQTVDAQAGLRRWVSHATKSGFFASRPLPVINSRNIILSVEESLWSHRLSEPLLKNQLSIHLDIIKFWKSINLYFRGLTNIMYFCPWMLYTRKHLIWVCTVCQPFCLWLFCQALNNFWINKLKKQIHYSRKCIKLCFNRSIYMYSKTCIKRPLPKRPKIGFQY